MTENEDTDRIIAKALEPEPVASGAVWGGMLLSAGKLWEYWGANNWRPRAISTQDYAAFDALMRFAEADPTHRVHHHICEREHYIHLHGGDGWRFEGGWGSFASAASDGLGAWVRGKE